uniref:DUF8039 domain-containing protein n=1 Tax=Oryza brachyantha TaxID=4533 RepID=J3LWZ9_ORYBR
MPGNQKSILTRYFILTEYAKVQIDKVHSKHAQLELDIATLEGVELLKNAVNQFILEHRRDIICSSESMRVNADYRFNLFD